MVLIAASILASDLSRLGDAVTTADKAGADWIHLDIMDGHFVPNLTFGPSVVRDLRKYTEKPFDAHLMVNNPVDLIPELLGTPCQSISVHQEVCDHLHRTLDLIKRGGCKAGVVINPATSIYTLTDMLPMMDYVLIMSVNPGFAYQKHIPETTEKIRRFNDLANDHGWKGMIQVDGGIDASNAKGLCEAGADIFVVGGAIYTSGNGSKLGSADYMETVRGNIEKIKSECS